MHYVSISITVNLALEHLLANRKWPYALSKNAHYDIYIGVDVHDRYVGLTFFYKNGEKIYFDSKKVPMKTGFKRAEKIRSKDLVEKIYEKLKAHIPLHCNNPNGIVLIRDGRSFGEEEKALLEVIEKERRLELCFEGDRIHYLRRKGAFYNNELIIRDAAWDCDGFLLQFPSTEQTAVFEPNPPGGC